ncbi:MAG: hypothetical protein QM831_39950 [Kofleriaceae bacterium]
MGRAMLLLITLGACRMGFDDLESKSPGDDESGGSGSDVVSPDVLSCAAGPQRFVVGSDLNGIAAAATDTGFAVATVDSSGNLKGWSYALDSQTGELSANAQAVTIAAQMNGVVGLATNGSTVMLAAQTSAGGTTIYPLAANDLSSRGTPSSRTTEFAGPVPIASSGGTFAYISQLGDSSVQLHGLDATGADTVKLTLTSTDDMAYSPTLVPGPNGYAVVYGAWKIDGGAAIALYDPQMNQLIAPQKIEPNPAYFAEQPVLAYADKSGECLASWHIKDADNNDIIYARLLGADFVPVGDPFLIHANADNATIATDGTDFYLSYLMYAGMTSALGASKISAAGEVTPVEIIGDGGQPSKWAFVERGEQTVLVWREVGGTGPDLYFDPMCP